MSKEDFYRRVEHEIVNTLTAALAVTNILDIANEYAFALVEQSVPLHPFGLNHEQMAGFNSCRSQTLENARKILSAHE
jgi:hypothetical protein